MIARFITHSDLHAYRHWRVTYYGERGDNLSCFVASWNCCCLDNPTLRAEFHRETVG